VTTFGRPTRALARGLAAVMLATSGVVTLAAAPAPAADPEPVPCVGCYVPPVRTNFQIQLTGKVNRKVIADFFDIDLFDNAPSVVADLHARGRKVACYFSAGSFENWRPDAALFPESVKGRSNGWPGERWLDVRRLDVLGPIIDARLDLCRAKGFDSVDPDNVDAWTNTSGFPITAADQLTFNRYIANAAHSRGLSVGLKNDLDQIPELLPYFDWAINEQCAQYAECDLLVPFVQSGKAVMQIEYKWVKKRVCPAANARDFNAYKKSLALGPGRVACR
jgi:hypothetical protein